MELASDAQTCNENKLKNILLMGIGKRLVYFKYHPFGRKEEDIIVWLDYNVHKMAFNSISNDVIAFDKKSKLIFSLNLANFGMSVIISKNLGTVSAMSFGKFHSPPFLCSEH